MILGTEPKSEEKGWIKLDQKKIKTIQLNLEMRDVFDSIKRPWQFETIFHFFFDMFLVVELLRHHFEAPADWPGYRHLIPGQH